MRTFERMPFLKGGENRKSFFDRITRFYPEGSGSYNLILQAYDTAKDNFRGVWRDDRVRYFEHLRAVALTVFDYLRRRDPNLTAASLLHDIVEDRPSWTVERVEREFNKNVARLVDFVSKPKISPPLSRERMKEIYHERLSSAPRRVLFVKLSDRLHNISTSAIWEKKRRRRYIKETREVYLSLAEKHFILLHELEEALEDLEQTLA